MVKEEQRVTGRRVHIGHLSNHTTDTEVTTTMSRDARQIGRHVGNLDMLGIFVEGRCGRLPPNLSCGQLLGDEGRDEVAAQAVR